MLACGMPTTWFAEPASWWPTIWSTSAAPATVAHDFGGATGAADVVGRVVKAGTVGCAVGCGPDEHATSTPANANAAAVDPAAHHRRFMTSTVAVAGPNDEDPAPDSARGPAKIYPSGHTPPDSRSRS